MNKTIEAFLRESGGLRPLAITSESKPGIEQAVIARWQRLFDLIAREAREPGTLILRITSDSIRMLFQSGSKNQTNTEYYFANGLYCHSVLDCSGVLIENAMAGAYINREYRQQPAVFTSYGLPIYWPDGELFGLICLLHQAKKARTKSYATLVSVLKETFEQELAAVCMQQQLVLNAETDPLTKIFNRRKINSVLKTEFDRAKRYSEPFSVIMMDLNQYKQINDTYGHNVGDEVLKAFVQSIGSKLRETDCLGRWGGDEFILICPNTGSKETNQMIARIQPSVNEDMKALPAFYDFSFGIAQYEDADTSYQEMLQRADAIMYEHKSKMKAKDHHIA